VPITCHDLQQAIELGAWHVPWLLSETETDDSKPQIITDQRWSVGGKRRPLKSCGLDSASPADVAEAFNAKEGA
jgi:hypothetical protein